MTNTKQYKDRETGELVNLTEEQFNARRDKYEAVDRKSDQPASANRPSDEQRHQSERRQA